MNRRIRSTARGGSTMSMMGMLLEVAEEGWEMLNMSLKTGDAKDRKILWTRKSRLSEPWAARSITSPSGQLNISSEFMMGSVEIGAKVKSVCNRPDARATIRSE